MITRRLLHEVMPEVEEKINRILKNHGLVAKYKGSTDFATVKFELATKNSDGTVNSKERTEFTKMAGRYGLSESDLGREFTYGGRRYEITGLNTRRHKYPLSASRIPDGESFKFPIDVIRTNVGSSVTPEIKKAFESLACELSPENLTCDGELTGAAVTRKLARIKRDWRALEARIGRKVSETEAWDL